MHPAVSVVSIVGSCAFEKEAPAPRPKSLLGKYKQESNATAKSTAFCTPNEDEAHPPQNNQRKHVTLEMPNPAPQSRSLKQNAEALNPGNATLLNENGMRPVVQEELLELSSNPIPDSRALSRVIRHPHLRAPQRVALPGLDLKRKNPWLKHF